MAVKKKGDAEAVANLVTKHDYITIRNTMQEDTHVARLFDWLWHNGSITPMECYDFLGNTRIGSTVGILRHQYGVPVKMEMCERKSLGKTVRYGKYSIERG